MAFRELMRRLLVADITLGVLLGLSYLASVASNTPFPPETVVVLQLGGLLVLANFLLIGGVLYSGWEPV